MRDISISLNILRRSSKLHGSMRHRPESCKEDHQESLLLPHVQRHQPKGYGENRLWHNLTRPRHSYNHNEDSKRDQKAWTQQATLQLCDWPTSRQQNYWIPPKPATEWSQEDYCQCPTETLEKILVPPSLFQAGANYRRRHCWKSPHPHPINQRLRIQDEEQPSYAWN